MEKILCWYCELEKLSEIFFGGGGEDCGDFEEKFGRLFVSDSVWE